MKYHIIAFISGFFLDLILGDPHFIYHPVRLMGRLISFFENIFLKEKSTDANYCSSKKRFYGFITVCSVIFVSGLIPFGILFTGYKINIWAGTVIESFMTYQLLATKSLKDESMKVYRQIKNNSIENARKALSMIVGRDTQNLNEKQIIRAAVETVAENTSDGIIAPMIYTALGGPVLGFMYKAVNTMDSMIGYKNEKYIDFGRCAAKTDDAVNFIPSRISALLMILSCILMPFMFSVSNALKIFLRDRFNHESPNSAQTESVMAGALKVRLAGPAFYHGILEQKLFLGDDIRDIENKDIVRANVMLYCVSFLCMIFCSVVMYIIYLRVKV